MKSVIRVALLLGATAAIAVVGGQARAQLFPRESVLFDEATDGRLQEWITSTNRKKCLGPCPADPQCCTTTEIVPVVSG